MAADGRCTTSVQWQLVAPMVTVGWGDVWIAWRAQIELVGALVVAIGASWARGSGKDTSREPPGWRVTSNRRKGWEGSTMVRFGSAW
ncbi:hypothetical protein V6N11_080605 [Hibiscus sabdariffa]|uniref:WAT1-related protein n=1 Tax=Hibiscus sabdariffa TaxID=183260 RepID=A0ABR2R854_9ROSI